MEKRYYIDGKCVLSYDDDVFSTDDDYTNIKELFIYPAVDKVYVKYYEKQLVQQVLEKTLKKNDSIFNTYCAIKELIKDEPISVDYVQSEEDTLLKNLMRKNLNSDEYVEFEKLLDENKQVCTLGPIIHNPQMVDSLKKRGVIIAENIDEVPKGYTVVIRSHGVDKDTYKQIEKNNLEICDATCPFVYKIHKIVDENSNENTPVLIAGDEAHAEVIGIKGFANGKVYCFTTEEELSEIVKNCKNMEDNPPIIVAQTTFNQKNGKISKKL